MFRIPPAHHFSLCNLVIAAAHFRNYFRSAFSVFGRSAVNDYRVSRPASEQKSSPELAFLRTTSADGRSG
jgi:hypothetical protein